MDCNPPGSPVHAILQARILEYWPFPSPGDLLNPGIKPGSPALQADSLPSETAGKPYLLESELTLYLVLTNGMRWKCHSYVSKPKS